MHKDNSNNNDNSDHDNDDLFLGRCYETITASRGRSESSSPSNISSVINLPCDNRLKFRSSNINDLLISISFLLSRPRMKAGSSRASPSSHDEDDLQLRHLLVIGLAGGAGR